MRVCISSPSWKKKMNRYLSFLAAFFKAAAARLVAGSDPCAGESAFARSGQCESEPPRPVIVQSLGESHLLFSTFLVLLK